MSGISRNLIDEVKAHVSILDLAKDYFTLTNERGLFRDKGCKWFE